MISNKQPFPVLMIMSLFFLFIGFQSCTYRHYQGFEEASDTEVIFPLIYDTSFRKATYATDFEVAGNQLSGITIVKKVYNTNAFHVVFMSQIGLKYFDIKIAMEAEDWFGLNYIMKSLDKEFIVDALKKDFELLYNKNKHKNITFFQDPETSKQEIISRIGKEAVSYLIEDNNIKGISLFNRRSTIISIQLPAYSKGYPKKMIINNKKARVKISLSEF
jgi:hypothetical protein